MTRSRRDALAWIDALEPRRLFSTSYVSTAGSDSTGNGTAAHPFATIQYAGALTQPGDTVNVEPGSYAGAVFGWDSNPASASDDIGIIAGTASAPITIQADPSAAAGSVLITSRNRESADGLDLEPGCNDVILKGFTVDNTDGSMTRAGIRVTQSDGVQVLDNTVHDAGTWGIFTAFGTDLVINGNTAADSQTQHGIYVSNSAVDPTIVGNTCYGNAECGIELNGDASQGDTGLDTAALIAGNILFNNGLLGGSTINCDGMVDSTIENNLLFNNHASGISLFQEDGATGSTGNVVVNNTIDMADDARWAININSGSTGNTLLNNILLNQNPTHGDILIDTSSLAGFSSDDNVTDGRFDVGDGSTVMSLADWRKATKQDTNSVVSSESALFRDVSSSNYALTESAVAASIGAASLNGQNAPVTDLTGATRTTPTAGAYAPGSSGGISIDTAPLPAPTRLHAIAGPGDAALSWTDNSGGAARFEVQELIALPRTKGQKAKTAFSNLALTDTGVTSYDVTELSPLHKYTFRVEAVSPGGVTASGAAAAVTKHLARPTVVTDPVVTADDATDVTLTWTDADAGTQLLTGFRIYRRPTLHGRGGKFVLLTTTSDATVLSYTDSTAVAGVTYQYRIGAVNAAGATLTRPLAATSPAAGVEGILIGPA